MLSMSHQKMMYFVHINHNPMNSNPNGATSRWDSLIKPTRIVINLFLNQKMMSPPTVSDIGVMSSVHGDPLYALHSPRGH